jgi:curli biogenesis system outer membrane secretion channel CsgG
MNRINLVLVGVAVVGLTACATAKVTSSGGQDMASAQMEAYNGPKARIAVADFEDKMSSSGHYRGEYGRGMSDMLTNALFQSNRYIVLEREKLEAVLAEQNLGASGRVKKDTAAAIGELEGAELMVTAAITGFDPGASGGGGGLGGLIPGGQMLGAVTGSFQKAHVAMDLRVIDTRTARVLAATSVEGSATAFGGGGLALGGAMGGGLGGFSKTPMETAIRKMITEAVKFIAAQTPQEFYRFSATGAPMTKVRAAAVEADEEEAMEEAPTPKAAKPKPSTGQSMAKTPAADGLGTPKARKTIQSIKSEVDPDLIAHLNEVKRRGAVLTVVVTLTMSGSKKESESFSISHGHSKVMDYDTAETYDLVKIDGFTGGRLKSGEVKTFQTTFKAPKEAKKVGITFSGLGTFDDVVLE